MLYKYYLLALAVCLSGPIHAQQAAAIPSPLPDQFVQLLNKSETYKEYKVIRMAELNVFQRSLTDSLLQNVRRVASLENSIARLQTDSTAQVAALATAQASLEQSEALNASIGVLGISMNKTSYQLMVLVLLLGLGTSSFFFYYRFKRGHVNVRRVTEDHQRLRKEFEQLRYSAKETQIKLKRELQTAINKLDPPVSS